MAGEHFYFIALLCPFAVLLLYCPSTTLIFLIVTLAFENWDSCKKKKEVWIVVLRLMIKALLI